MTSVLFKGVIPTSGLPPPVDTQTEPSRVKGGFSKAGPATDQETRVTIQDWCCSMCWRADLFHSVEWGKGLPGVPDFWGDHLHKWGLRAESPDSGLRQKEPQGRMNAHVWRQCRNFSCWGMGPEPAVSPLGVLSVADEQFCSSLVSSTYRDLMETTTFVTGWFH